MKICLVAHLNDLSGANKSLMDLATGLAVSNDVTVIVPRKGPLYDELLCRKIRTIVVFSGSWVYKRDEKCIKKVFKRVVNFFAEFKFKQLFKTEHFDVVHYNSYIYGAGASSLLKMGMPYTWHIRELPEENFNLSFFNKERTNTVISKSDAIVTISNFMKDALPSQFRNKISVIYNGISIDKSTWTYNPIIHIDDMVIIGAIAEDKGQIDAIRALLYLNSLGISMKLYIVGKVTDEAYYKQIIQEIPVEYRDCILFEGYKNDVSDYRKCNRIALVCSKAEAFGRVTIEAMAAGQIVIGADTGATPEIISDGNNGFLYKQGDYLDLANKIIAVLKSDNLERVSNNARESVANCFCVEKTVRSVEEFLSDVISKRNG